MGKVHLRLGAFFPGFSLTGAFFLALFATAAPAAEQAQAVAAKPVNYESQVKPLLTTHCVRCHGAAKPRGGLRLDTAAMSKLGGKGGPAVLPGNGHESPLVEAIRGEGATDRMPLNRPALAEAEIKLIETWIDQGATARPDEKPGVPPAEAHWAFVPPVRPAVPRVKNSGWGRNPIDAFILARLEAAGLTPSPEANARTLIRRLSLDLTGLPPSPEEVDAFLADGSQAAKCKAVDRLLASPAFRRAMGEALARPGALRRFQRLQHRCSALDLEISRLGDRGDQLRDAV